MKAVTAEASATASGRQDRLRTTGIANATLPRWYLDETPVRIELPFEFHAGEADSRGKTESTERREGFRNSRFELCAYSGQDALDFQLHRGRVAESGQKAGGNAEIGARHEFGLNSMVVARIDDAEGCCGELGSVAYIDFNAA